MATEWRSMCDTRMTVDNDDVIVKFDNGRQHRVRVVEKDDTLEIHATVAKPGAVGDIRELPQRIWLHNRAAQLVSFRRDTRGRVVAHGWLPKAGLTAEEFRLVIQRVAAGSDRLEFLLTGRDVE